MKLTPHGVALTALAIGLAGFGWNAMRRKPAPAVAGVSELELRWLQNEYRLDDVVMQRIAPLHRAHVVECERHCLALAGNEEQMQALMARCREMTPELAETVQRASDLGSECRQHMLAYFYAVAREMPPPEASRYLARMLPVVAHPERSEAVHRP